MAYGKARFGRTEDYELLRYCNKLNTTVVGGFQRLVKLIPGTYVSFANRRWSSTIKNVYESTGHQRLGISNPAFYVVDFSSGVLHNRLKFQKHKLGELLEGYDPTLTANQNIFNHDLGLIYDCGNIIYRSLDTGRKDW